MKLRLAIILMLAFACCERPTQAADTNAAVVSGRYVSSFPGRTVPMPISLTHTGGVSGLQLDLKFATNKLGVGTFQSAGLSNNVVLRWRQIAPGQHRVLAYTKDATVLKTNQMLGLLPFTVPDGDFTAGGPVIVTNAVVSKTNANSAVPLKINNGAIVLSPIFRGEDGVVDLYLSVQSNKTYVVQATTNFINWINISTNFASLDYIVVTDPGAANLPDRFYRPVQITDVPWVLKILGIQTNGGIALQISGVVGQSYVLQASSDLKHWSNISTNVLVQYPQTWVDNAANNVAQRFYRIVPVGSVPTGSLTIPKMISSNQMSFTYSTYAGERFILQASTNLNFWENLSTNVAASNVVGFTNQISPAHPKRFFRVFELP